MILLAEETRAKFPVGGKANARTVAAERLGHRGDEPDFAGSAIRESVLACRLTSLVRDLDQRPSCMNSLVNFRCRHDEVARPGTVGVKRHELDKAHDYASFARKFGKRFHLVVV